MAEIIKYLSTGVKEKPKNNEYINGEDQETTITANTFVNENKDKKIKFGFLYSNNV